MGLRSFRKADKDHLGKRIKIKSRSFRQVNKDRIKKFGASRLSNHNWKQCRILFQRRYLSGKFPTST